MSRIEPKWAPADYKALLASLLSQPLAGRLPDDVITRHCTQFLKLSGVLK